MATKYNDVLSAAKDLLTKNYNFTNKVEVKTTAPNGVSFTADANLGAGKGVSANLKSSFDVAGVSVDKLAIGTNKVVTLETSVKDVLEGAKLTFKCADGARAAKDSYGKIGINYNHGTFAGTFDVDAINGPIVNSTAAFGYEGFILGGSVKANTNLHGDKPGAGFELSDYSAGLAYKTKEFEAAVKLLKCAKKVNAGFHHSASDELEIAGDATFSLDRSQTESPFDVQFGLGYKIDKDSSVEAKVSSNGKVSANYLQKLSGCARLTVSAQANAADLVSDDHKFGLKLKFNN